MKRLMFFFALGIFLSFASSSFAFTLNFESYPTLPAGDPSVREYPYLLMRDVVRGSLALDGNPKVMDIRTMKWDAYSEDTGIRSGTAKTDPPTEPFYHLQGNRAMWTGGSAMAGGYDAILIDFTNSILTDKSLSRPGIVDTFRVNYSSKSPFHVEAFFADSTSMIFDGPAAGYDTTLGPTMGLMDVSKYVSAVDTNHALINYVVLYNEPGTDAYLVDNVSNVPEPATFVLLAGGLITFLGYRMFRRT